jgi:hypothetical protein
MEIPDFSKEATDYHNKVMYNSDLSATPYGMFKAGADLGYQKGYSDCEEQKNSELQETREAWKKDRDELQVKRLEAEKELIKLKQEIEGLKNARF